MESSSLEINDIEIKGYVLFSKREITRLYLKDLKAYPLNKRKDEIKRFEDVDSLLANAPTQDQHMFKLPKVLN